jgi:hypothetical protein
MTINLTSTSLVGTVADLKTFNGAALFDQHVAIVSNAGNGVAKRFRFVVGLASTDATEQLVVAPTTGAATGKWLCCDNTVALKFPWAFDTADNSVLITIPTGLRFHVMRVVPEIVGALGGVDTGKLGIDSSVSLNPGALGTFTGFVSGFAGTVGAEIDDPKSTTLVAGDTLRHNLITGGFTAGTGFWHIVGSLIQL